MSALYAVEIRTETRGAADATWKWVGRFAEEHWAAMADPRAEMDRQARIAGFAMYRSVRREADGSTTILYEPGVAAPMLALRDAVARRDAASLALTEASEALAAAEEALTALHETVDTTGAIDLDEPLHPAVAASLANGSFVTYTHKGASYAGILRTVIHDHRVALTSHQHAVSWAVAACATCGDEDHSTAEHASPLDAIPDDLGARA